MTTLRVDTIIDGAVVESETFVPSNEGGFASSHMSCEANAYQHAQMAKVTTDETRLYMDGKLLSVWGVGDDFLPYADQFPSWMVTPIREAPVFEPRETKKTRHGRKAA